MGVIIYTRIHNQFKSDYIDLYNRNWDGDLIKLKEDFKEQKIYWKKFIDALQEDIINSEYDFSSLIDWADNFENFLHINEYFPSIENSCALYSMKAFNGYHIVPHYTSQSKQLLDFWGYNYPNLNVIHKGNSFSFSSINKEIKLEPKEINNKEFKVIRIQTQNAGERKIFLDIKVRNFDRKKFLFTILTLPEFWRNFHFVSRKKKGSSAVTHPAYNINRSLINFYTPGKSFTINSVVNKNKKDVYENIKANLPLSLFINSFAMHLFFCMPGLALPVTASEQLWSATQKPEMTITLNESEINLITIDYDKNSENNKKTLQEFSDLFSEREQAFAQFFELGQYSGGQYLLTTSEEFAFVYETNMIELFDSLTKFDQLNSNI